MESAIYCGMESDQRSEWNRGNAVYGIKPQEIYSIRASRNAMRDFIAIPYNARGALIPYQACGMDKKEATFGRQKLLLFWWGRTDSNHRSDTQQIYSLSPLAAREIPHMELVIGVEPTTC